MLDKERKFQRLLKLNNRSIKKTSDTVAPYVKNKAGLTVMLKANAIAA